MARRRRLSNRIRAALGIVWVLVVALVAVYLVNGRRSELTGISSIFSHMNLYFLVPLLVLECGSMAAYAQLQRSMLMAGRVDTGFWRILAIFLSSNSITNIVPGGAAFASVYSYRRFRDVGASEGLSGWAVLAANVLAAMSLLLLAIVGLVISEGSLSGISLTGSLISVGIVLIGAFFLIARAERVIKAAETLLVFLEHKLNVSWKVTRKVSELEQDIRAISPSGSRLARAFIWGLVNWIFDASVLVIAYFATKSPVPFLGLLLAYSAGQLAANFPITPGGLGVVEGSISIALVAYGGNQEASIAAVLLYRLFSFWIWLLPGIGCYFGLRIKIPAAGRHAVSSELISGEGKHG